MAGEGSQPYLTKSLAVAGDYYKKGGQVGVAPIIRYDFYMMSIRNFNEALRHTANLEQRVSVLRNLGMASSKAHHILNEKEVDQRVYHANNSIKYFSVAYTDGKSIKPQEWIEKMHELIGESMDALASSSSAWLLDKRISLFLQLLPTIPNNNIFKSELLLRLSTLMFNTAIREQSKGEWANSFSILHSCTQYIEDGLKCSEGYVKGDLGELLERRWIHICIAESSKCLALADSMLKNHIDGDDAVNIDVMWAITDMYKQAALLTREKDMEGEAIALSRQGRIFDKVFKVQDKAHEYYRRALDLAIALQPRDFSHCEWFKECQQALQRFQQEVVLEAEKQRAQDRQPILDELKDVLAGFQHLHEPKTLIEFLYKTHPPKNPAYKTDEDQLLNQPATSMKVKILKAITYYHPDKQPAYTADKKWFVLCEEITKTLNARYAVFKEVK